MYDNQLFRESILLILFCWFHLHFKTIFHLRCGWQTRETTIFEAGFLIVFLYLLGAAVEVREIESVSMFTENCSIPLNGSEFDPGAVEFVNGTKSDGHSACGRFKSHPKDKDKRK